MKTQGHKGRGPRGCRAGGSRGWLIAGGLAIGLAARASAGEVPSPGCLDGGEPARIASIDPYGEPVLDDGRHLRLAGADLPSDADRLDRVRSALTTWLAGRTVLVRTLAAVPDRWERTPALVFATSDAGGRVSVVDALVEAGLVRASPDPATAACWPEVSGLEDSALTARRGLWADPRYAAIDANDSDRLLAAMGQRVLVEGRIVAVVEGRSRIYLRLTPYGRGGLVVSLASRLKTQIATRGHDEATWRGQSVRVRGFLDDRFGMEIDLTSPDQIEFTSIR